MGIESREISKVHLAASRLWNRTRKEPGIHKMYNFEYKLRTPVNSLILPGIFSMHFKSLKEKKNIAKPNKMGSVLTFHSTNGL